MATFKQIPADLARHLISFVDRRNLGKSIDIGGKAYTLDHISHNTSAFWRSRGLSVYFRTGRSVIRLSDHWSKSNGFERSRKLNCGLISGQDWQIENRDMNKLYCEKYAGRFPFEMLAGKCGLSKLNKTCEHWRG